MIRRRLTSILVVLLLTGVVVAVGVGTTGASAQVSGNTLDSIAVKVAACGGFDGRIDAVVTTDGTHAYLGNDTSGGSYNVGSLGAGTHTKDTQYFGFGVPANTILTVTVTLGSVAFTDDLGSETISFNCTTGEVIPDSTTTTTTPLRDRVAVGEHCEGEGAPFIRVFQNTNELVYFRVTIEGTVVEFTLPDGGSREFPMEIGDTYKVEYRFDEGDEWLFEGEDHEGFGPCSIDTTTTTTSLAVAPTSIVSTTVAATTTIAEVETDIVDGDSMALPMLGLAVIGLLALSAAAVRARRFDR